MKPPVDELLADVVVDAPTVVAELELAVVADEDVAPFVPVDAADEPPEPGVFTVTQPESATAPSKKRPALLMPTRFATTSAFVNRRGSDSR